MFIGRFGAMAAAWLISMWPMMANSAEVRNALIFGVTSGPEVRTLTDADHIDAALKGLGFTVVHENNATKERMRALLSKFKKSLSNGGVGLFYYAGHGAQVNGENYLLPTGSTINAIGDVKTEWLSLSEVLNVLTSAPLSSRLVFLDACRDNPFLTSLAAKNPAGEIYLPGLAKPEAAQSGTLISFAAAPNTLAAEGTPGHMDWYTAGLLKYIGEAGLDLDELLRRVGTYVDIASDDAQTPWVNTSARTKFYFRAPVFINAVVQSVDDGLILIANDEEVLGTYGPTGPTPVPLRAGENHLIVKIFNQRTFTGGVEGLGGHLPEGWSYTLRLQDTGGQELAPALTSIEDRPLKDGPHHGHLFTVATADVSVNRQTGAITVSNVDESVWRHDAVGSPPSPAAANARWRGDIDWSIANRTGPDLTDCPGDYTRTEPACLLGGGRACLMEKAIAYAKAGRCAPAVALTLITQCHNLDAQSAISTIPQTTICAYLSAK